jgi:hypothetical protein
MTLFASAPTPDLRIVMTQSLHPHEESDSQRLRPLVERVRTEPYMINPPIVAEMGGDEYVVLDGANRTTAFAELGYPHILVQVVSYESGSVLLENWQHAVCSWSQPALLSALRGLPDLEMLEGQHHDAIAHLLLRDESVIALRAPVGTVHERNAALRHVVGIYQRSAALHRTSLIEPEEVWTLHPDGVALVVFPRYQPSDIIAATKHKAFLPPGISRHIVIGRALRVNYPLDALRDPTQSLEAKNAALTTWLQAKVANRQMRFYAEPTYMFDE